MTPELATMIRQEIARLADQINELTAQRTALVKVLANGADPAPVVEAPEPPVIAFAATSKRGRRRPGDPTPTMREILRKIVADAGRDGVERQQVLGIATRQTNAKYGSINTTLSRMKTEGVFSENDDGILRIS